MRTAVHQMENGAFFKWSDLIRRHFPSAGVSEHSSAATEKSSRPLPGRLPAFCCRLSPLASREGGNWNHFRKARFKRGKEADQAWGRCCTVFVRVPCLRACFSNLQRPSPAQEFFKLFLLPVFLLLLAPSHDLLQLWWLRKQNNLQRDPCWKPVTLKDVRGGELWEAESSLVCAVQSLKSL